MFSMHRSVQGIYSSGTVLSSVRNRAFAVHPDACNALHINKLSFWPFFCNDT
jgi:hypothetical protein